MFLFTSWDCLPFFINKLTPNIFPISEANDAFSGIPNLAYALAA